MIALPLVNQSDTSLLSDRKSQPAPEPTEPAFDRNLKDADSRLDQSKPADRSSGSSENVTDYEAPKHTESNTDTDTRSSDGDNAAEQSSESPDTKAQETAEVDQPAETDAQTTNAEPVADQGQVATDVSTSQAQNQVVSQILTPGTESTVGQAIVSEQQVVAQKAQATAGQTEQVQAVTSLTDTASVESGQVSQQAVVQPKQDKAGDGLLTNQTTQSNQPSATSERIELVSESRQSDSQQAGTQDSSQQHTTSSNTDAHSQQSTINTSGSGTSQSAVGDATVSAVQTSAAPSVEQAATSEATGTSGAQQVKTDGEGNDRINTARIARGLQNAIQQKGGAVTLRLTPPEMGTVRIQLQIHNGTVNAQFHAETESTRSLLNQQISQLRASLEQQGLSVDRLGVQTMQQSSNSNLQHESQGDRDGQPNDGRSRGGFSRQGGDPQQGSDDSHPPEEFEQALSHAA